MRLRRVLVILFMRKLERVLREEEFDSFVESKCSPYYAKKQGRPSIPPGVYFRMLLIGYFEHIDSERGICWRCSDSLSLRQFLGLGMEERTPDHSSLSRIRNRLPLEVHESVFGWVLEVLASHWVWTRRRWKRMRRFGQSFVETRGKATNRACAQEWYRRAEPSGHSKKRPKKGSNKEWVPNEPDAEIMKMKSGGTDMAHKAEHAVDMSGEGAVIAVTLHGGRRVTQRAYRIRWKKPCKSSRTTRNVVNEYMKTRVAKWSRAITATTSWLSWSNKNTGATFRSQSEVAANGRTNRPSKPPPTRTDVAFAGLEVSD